MILFAVIVGLLVATIISLSFNRNTYLTDIMLNIGIKGFNLHIKAKEKSTPSSQD